MQFEEFYAQPHVHKYDLLYSKSPIQYASLAFRARRIYWILDCKFTQVCTYHTQLQFERLYQLLLTHPSGLQTTHDDQYFIPDFQWVKLTYVHIAFVWFGS